jgi:hypothetical protein
VEAIYIPSTEVSPLVEFNLIDTTLTLEGKIIPENVEEVFFPINTWIDKYFAENESLNVVFRLYYYNTSSFKRLYNLCRSLDAYSQNDKKIKVRWEYLEEDEDSKLDAEGLLENVHYPYEVVEVSA